MTFSEGGRFGGGRVRTRSGGGRGAAIGGGAGLGVIAIILLGNLLGVDLSGLASGVQQGGGGGGGTTGTIAECTAEEANANRECRLNATVESLDTYWSVALQEQTGVEYALPGVESFQQATQTACGSASAATGPFYCPPDQTVYLDLGFYDDLQSRFGASGGAFAELYVVAHEFGHHIQHMTGVMEAADRSGTGPDSDSVRIELMADCLAGMWAGHASTVVDPETGVTYLEPVTESELNDALSAASAVGDDRIQEQATGTVNPEAWTHGSSEQRQRWFLVGYQGGTFAECNALEAPQI